MYGGQVGERAAAADDELVWRGGRVLGECLHEPTDVVGGPLDAHDVRWEAIEKNDMSRWWFETGPMQEVAEVLAASYLQCSHHSGARTAGVRLMDRGMPMLEASVAATAAVRENLTPEQAAD